MWALVVAAASLLVKVFSSRIGLFIGSALVWLGLSYTSYSFGVTPFKSVISTEFQQTGFIMNWLGFFGVDKAVTIILSAVAAKYAVAGAKVALTKKG